MTSFPNTINLPHISKIKYINKNKIEISIFSSINEETYTLTAKEILQYIIDKKKKEDFFDSLYR